MSGIHPLSPGVWLMRRLRLRGKKHRQRQSRITTQPRRLGCGGVHGQKLLDRRTGGRLPALVQPHPRHHGRIIGPPDPRHENRILGGGHGAGRGAKDIGQGGMRVACAANAANATGMGVDHSGRDGSAGQKPKRGGGAARQARAKGGARLDHALADAAGNAVIALVGWHVPGSLVGKMGVDFPPMRPISVSATGNSSSA